MRGSTAAGNKMRTVDADADDSDADDSDADDLDAGRGSLPELLGGGHGEGKGEQLAQHRHAVGHVDDLVVPVCGWVGG